jgi:hypothetical protein
MNSSGQKTGFSIAVMIAVIIAAGIAVDLWDARQSHLAPKPVLETATDDPAVKRLVEENERLKTDNALLNMQNDALRKQIEEFSRKPAASPKSEIVQGDKTVGD